MALRAVRNQIFVMAFASNAIGSAHAEPSAQEKALATTLFNDGKALMTAGNIAAACRKFEESQRLDPGGGTLLALAICHEKEGRLASAWSEYTEAQAIAKRDGRADRVKLAAERIAAIGPRLSKLTIVVPKESDRGDLVITCDGAPVGRAAWGDSMPLDGGEHVVEAKAPGVVAFTARVTLAPSNDAQTITIGPLVESAPVASVAPASAASAPPSPVAPAVATTSVAPEAPPPRSTLRRDLGWVFGGLGVATLAAGGYFGLRAFSKRRESDEQCPTSSTCSPEGVTLNEQAGTAADVATVTIGIGAALLASGAVLVLTAPSARDAPSAVLAPFVGARDGGFVLRASF